jgi:hypothetical protein
VTTATSAPIETRAAALACGVAAVALLGWLLVLASRGLEFSDEGFYLTWLAQPGQLPTSITQFGFVYHPVHWLLDANIAALRRFNLLLTFGLAAGMFDALLGGVRDASRAVRAGVALALAACALAFFSSWLLTPSYNSLCLQSFLLAATGALRLEGERWRSAALLLGLGGALAFLAKPSSAAVLAVLMLGLVGTAPRPRWTGVLWRAAGIAAASVLLAACAIDGDPLRFVERLRLANEDWQRLVGWRGTAALFRWDPFALSRGEQLFIAAGAAAAIASAFALGAARRAWRIAGAAVTVAAALLAVAWLTSHPPILPRSQFVATLLCAPALALLPFAARGLDWRRVAQGLCLACLPAAYAFGTNNHYWQTGAFVGVFWIAGAAAAARTARFAIWPPVAALGLLASSTLLLQGALAPYRQRDPILEQHTRVSLPGGSALRLGQDSARYIEALQAAGSAGWVAGTPAIDLTGQSPTALHLLQARALGAAWWLGGYAGSDAVAVSLASRLPCEDLARAWLLHEPGGPRALSDALTQRWGLDLARDYAVAARFHTPPGAGDYPAAREQHLLRPLRDPAGANEACVRARAADPTPARG